MVTNLNKSRMTWKKKPAARKCLPVYTICCWYSLNGKYLCYVFLFTLLALSDFFFPSNHHYISAGFRKGLSPSDGAKLWQTGCWGRFLPAPQRPAQWDWNIFTSKPQPHVPRCPPSKPCGHRLGARSSSAPMAAQGHLAGTSLCVTARGPAGPWKCTVGSHTHHSWKTSSSRGVGLQFKIQR